MTDQELQESYIRFVALALFFNEEPMTYQQYIEYERNNPVTDVFDNIPDDLIIYDDGDDDISMFGVCNIADDCNESHYDDNENWDIIWED